ncbi:MAG: cation transporter [Chloroflexi bacterium]|nr:cation transporter [Chloroflexota bacterium]
MAGESEPHHHDHPHGDHPHPHAQGQEENAHDHDHPHPHPVGAVARVAHDHDHQHPHPHNDDARAHTHGPNGEPEHDHGELDHGHDHGEGEHDHDHDHDHGHSHGRFGWLMEFLPFGHGHSHGPTNLDNALESDARGIWALKVSLVMLAVTAIFQIVIVFISGSVALLADTIHNFSDATTAIPLWIAFVVGRRVANRRYTYGYGRVEDLAGVLIVLIIFISAMVAGFESIQKLINPQPITNIGWVIVAAIVGFIGNEAVAILRIRVGNEIGSAALVADGQHARVDGFTSLAVLFGALGVLAGFPLFDPIIGILITVAILFIVKDSALTMWRRLMDAIEPELLEKVENTTRKVPGVNAVGETRMRWLGHKLEAEVEIMVDGNLTTTQSHEVVEEVRHALFHAQPRLQSIIVQVNPGNEGNYETNHQLTAHHQQRGRLIGQP